MLKRLATVAACLSVLALSACGNEADGKDTATDPSASESSSESSSESTEQSSESPEASGATTTSAYSRGVIKFMANHGISKADPVALAIR